MRQTFSVLILVASLCGDAFCTLQLFDFAGDNPSGFPGLGHSVAGGTDVDGDGIPDVLVGAPYENGAQGQAKVFSGADGSQILLLQSPSAGHFGNSVAMLGDVNGDGTPDLVVGAEEFTVFNQLPGYAEVRSGADGSVIHHWNGVGGRDQFGDAVASAGDTDGDGIPDVIVGAPLNDGGGTDAGMARVYSGSTGALLHSLVGTSAGDHFGTSVAGLGDVDGDGFSDFVVGAPDGGPGSSRGQVRVYSGDNAQVLFTFNGPADFDRRGWSVAGAGNVDADGIPDITFGSPNAFGTGAVEVRSGADGSLLHRLAGTWAGGQFGWSVAGAGDVDADGFADIVVGAHNGSLVGEAWAFSGRDGSTLWTVSGSAAGDRLGLAVAGAGDIDGDGFADVVVGADQFSNSGPGHAFVYSGRPALTGDVQQISLTTGGVLQMSLQAPAAYAGGLYVILGSVTGYAPGLPLPGGANLPLNVDLYFNLILQAPALFPSFFGHLNASATASASLAIPAGLGPALIGLRLHHAFVARHAGQADSTSNPVLIELAP